MNTMGRDVNESVLWAAGVADALGQFLNLTHFLLYLLYFIGLVLRNIRGLQMV